MIQIDQKRNQTNVPCIHLQVRYIKARFHATSFFWGQASPLHHLTVSMIAGVLFAQGRRQLIWLAMIDVNHSMCTTPGVFGYEMTKNQVVLSRCATGVNLKKKRTSVCDHHSLYQPQKNKQFSYSIQTELMC